MALEKNKASRANELGAPGHAAPAGSLSRARSGTRVTRRPFLDEDGIAALVTTFYAAAKIDDVIGPMFIGAVEDWETHLLRLTDFWSSVMLTTGRYKGNPFRAHRPLAITPEMFDRWLKLWRATARQLFHAEPAAALINKAERIAASLSDGLFFKA